MDHSVLFDKYKKLIADFLQKYIKQEVLSLKSINSFSNDIENKLLPFVISGKMIRGSLVLYVQETFGGKITDDALFTAAALELFHSSLLIHDDIMDNDTL